MYIQRVIDKNQKELQEEFRASGRKVILPRNHKEIVEKLKAETG